MALFTGDTFMSLAKKYYKRTVKRLFQSKIRSDGFWPPKRFSEPLGGHIWLPYLSEYSLGSALLLKWRRRAAPRTEWI